MDLFAINIITDWNKIMFFKHKNKNNVHAYFLIFSIKWIKFYFNIFTVSSHKDEYSVCGFIRNFQQSLPYQTISFYIIPMSIISMCLNYFGNNFNQYYSAGHNYQRKLGRDSDNNQLIGPILEMNNIPIKYISTGMATKSIFWIGIDDKLYIHGTNYENVFALKDQTNVIKSPIIAEHITSKELKAVQAATGVVSIVLCNDGSVWSAGKNIWREHGHAHIDSTNGEYKQLHFSVKIKKVSLGSGTSLFLGENGEIWASGYNGEGTLGLGHKKTDRTKGPAKIVWFRENNIFIIDVEMSSYHVIALDNNGSIYCWGLNSNGRCGVDSTNRNNVLLPNKVEFTVKDIDIAKIRIGATHTGCITRNGECYLWGSNEHNECCVEDDEIDSIFNPYNVTKYVFDKSDCREILDMVLAECMTMFLLKDS